MPTNYDIVLVEGDYYERVFIEVQLALSFPGTTVTSFGSVGKFLETYEDPPKPFVLITELILPLFAVQNGDDELLDRTERLRTRFPWLGEDWEGLHGGEVLVRGMRSVDGDMPIIIYTDVDRDLISTDVTEISGYCLKGPSPVNLFDLIQQASTKVKLVELREKYTRP